MSPVSREINGSRPAPLKIHKDSHLIYKSSSSSTSTITTSSHQQQRHHPVIIYTHSPKVIHTQARDFMALVQKLTGLSHSADDDGSSSFPPAPPPSNPSRTYKDNKPPAAPVCDDSSSSSENGSFGGDVHVSCSLLTSAGGISPIAFEQVAPPNPFLSESPLFTPNSSDFFCSSRSFYRYPDSSVFSPPVPNMDNAISSSIMDTMKTYQEY
ncbi:hypothetical protein OPV22_013902 [Ensete ventricosum]|uniref:VQ domain-containing protein n=1 Tax=Ensete ventricosum TaxID=4639 RepID=A0AAV8RAQ7_ENSVE|nr:hypothetical protein OPV22_013902 [Ensete ventricosum]RZS25593.1 hypothetical protein BHM03_00058819 [Ensete ventricosum]